MRFPVWTAYLPAPRGCVGLAEGDWGCTESARFLLGTDPYCADCFVRELETTLFVSKIMGGIRAMEPERVSA